MIAEPGSEILAAKEIEDLELISDEEKLMVADMDHQDVEDPITPENFTIEREDFDGWTLFTVMEGENIAARGRMSVVDEFAILDRIFTSSDYRRLGLGTFVTRALLAIAHEHDVDEGLLVATADGVELYRVPGMDTFGRCSRFRRRRRHGPSVVHIPRLMRGSPPDLLTLMQ